MTAAEKTVGFLRTLAYDGFLSSDEVWLLAKFLNEHEDCRNCWPGDLLFPLLRMSFADGELSQDEMTIVATTLAMIERQYTQDERCPVTETTEDIQYTRTVAPERVEEPFHLNSPRLPVVDFVGEVPSSSGDESYQVSLLEHTCTCPDWIQRRKHPAGHLGRCCKHLAVAINESGVEPEPWLGSILDDLLYRGRGTHPADDWIQISLPKRKPIVISGGSGEWFNVFASTSEGYQRYGYNAAQGRWSYGEAPRGAAHVQEAIHKRFSF